MTQSNPKLRLGGSVAMALVASELAIMFMGATLPTPLYPLYRRSFGFSATTLTLVYAVYVLGNLAALVFFGRLSDQIGRRAVTLPAIGLALASTIVFALASGTAWLFVARMSSGFATGLAVTAATAWIAELQPRGDKEVAARLVSAANFAGLAVGPLMAGLLAQFVSGPLRVPYIVYAVVLFSIGGAILFVPETVKRPMRQFKDLSLRPRFGVPRNIRPQFLAPATTAFVIVALLGFYAALIPTLLADSLHRTAPVTSGEIVFELFAVATLTVIATGKLKNQTAMLSGLALLPPSLGLLVAAQLVQSMPVLLIATALGGGSAALGYRGSLAVVNQIAPADRRGEVVSSYLVACYAGNSLPVIGIGVLSVFASLTVAHIVFAAVIAAFAVVALAAGVKYGSSRSFCSL